MKVYLVGPITGCAFEEATLWRNEVTKILESLGHIVFNPMSGKDELKKENKIALSYKDYLMCRDTHIFQADLYKVRQSDVLFCNFLNLKSFTIGSFFEIGYAFAYNKAIIVITTDKMIAEHPFIKNSAFIASSIDEGIEILEKLVK